MSKRTQGVITIFLIIIMIPMMTLGVVLIDGARVRSAKMIVQEAADIAAMSVLSDYNTLLKDEFGLFAINDSSSAQSKFSSYLKASLNAYGGADVDSYSGMVQNLLQRSVFGGGDYVDKDFMNLYNFDVKNSNVEMLYNLAHWDVLESQVVQYAKFRGIIPIMRRLSVLSKAGQLKGEIEESEAALNAMSEKIDIDEDYATRVESSVHKVETGVGEYNDAMSDLTTAESEYKTALTDYLRDLEDDGEASSSKADKYTAAKSEFESCLTDVADKHDALKSACATAIDNINAAVPQYESFAGKYASYEGDSAQKELSDDAKKAAADYGKCKTDIQKLQIDLSAPDAAEVIKTAKGKIVTVQTKISDSISAYKDLKSAAESSEDEDEDEEPEFEFIKTDNNRTADSATARQDYCDGIHKETDKLDDDYSFINALKTDKTSDFGEDSAKDIGDSVNKKNDEKKDESGKVKLTDGEYDALPSRNEQTTTYDYDDVQLDKDKGADTVRSISGSLGSFMKDFIASGTNDMLVYAYILGTFKTRITGNTDIVYNDPPNPLENYHTKWRYGDKPVSDLRGRPIADRKTKFKNAEVEYIFAGNKSEAANEVTVYAWIYTTRMANNLIAVYLDKGIEGANTQCLIAANAAAALTGFTVPVPVFHWIFMLAWAAGETAFEMSLLIDKGYSVPLIKTKNNLYIDSITKIADFVGGGADGVVKASDNNSFLLSYEDYLIIMLAFVGSETRLARTADLIQLNMGELGQSGFKMAEAYTYFKSSSNIGIKYLFSGVSQFEWGYNGSGLGFENTIYKGY
jgi:hypothetical protein